MDQKFFSHALCCLLAIFMLPSKSEVEPQKPVNKEPITKETIAPTVKIKPKNDYNRCISLTDKSFVKQPSEIAKFNKQVTTALKKAKILNRYLLIRINYSNNLQRTDIDYPSSSTDSDKQQLVSELTPIIQKNIHSVQLKDGQCYQGFYEYKTLGRKAKRHS